MGWWTETADWSFGNPYLQGKEGWLPDWKIKGTPIGEVFSAEGYRKGGEWYRKAATSRVSGFFGGLTGGKKGGKDKWDGGLGDEFKFWGDRYGDLKRAAKDPVGTATSGIEFPGWFKDWKPPSGSDIDLTPIGQGISNLGTSLGEAFGYGMGAMGEGLGAAIAGGMPSMPSMQLIGDEGEPNMLVIGGLALVAYMVLKGRK